MDFVVSGFLTGFVVGVAGMGGGALMTPLLIVLFGMVPSAAIGTDLVFAFVTKGVGILSYAKLGRVDWRMAGAMLLGSAPTALCAPLVLGHFIPRQSFDLLLSLLISVMLIVSSLFLLFDHGSRKMRSLPGLCLSGAVIGILVSLTSVGAGALGMLALLRFGGDASPRELVATDLAHAVPLAGLAAIPHLSMIDFSVLTMLLVGSVPGIMLGSKCSGAFSAVTLRRILAVLMSLSGCSLLWKVL